MENKIYFYPFYASIKNEINYFFEQTQNMEIPDSCIGGRFNYGICIFLYSFLV